MELIIGRVLRADNTRCAVAVFANPPIFPELANLVRLPVDPTYQIYGMVDNIQINNDDLMRQVAVNENLDPSVIEDQRYRHSPPLEVEVIFLGSEKYGAIQHQLPPTPPRTLDLLYICSPEEVRRFTTHGHFGYLRHLVNAASPFLADLFAAHIQQAGACHRQVGNTTWEREAVREIIALLRDNYPVLMDVMSTLADTSLDFQGA